MVVIAVLVGLGLGAIAVYRRSIAKGTACLGAKVAGGGGGACEGQATAADLSAQANALLAPRQADAPTCSANGTCTNGACFAAGTPVLTPDGERAIESLTAGDVVLAKDVETGEIATRPIVAAKVTHDRPSILLELRNDTGQSETLVVTANHPFFVEGRGFEQAGDLQPGDVVTTPTGGAHVVALAAHAVVEPVYNIEVESFHTYFVGHSHVLVHNDCDLSQSAWLAAYTVRDAARITAYTESYAKLKDALVEVGKTQRGTPANAAAAAKLKDVVDDFKKTPPLPYEDVDIMMAQILGSPNADPRAKAMIAEAITSGRHEPMFPYQPTYGNPRSLKPLTNAEIMSYNKASQAAWGGAQVREQFAVYAAQRGTPEVKSKALSLLVGATSTFDANEAYAIFGKKLQGEIERGMKASEGPWKEVASLLQIKDLSRDPKWSGKVQTEILEMKLERAWKHADVAAKIAQMHKDTLSEVRSSKSFASQLEMLRSEAFLLRLELEGPEQAKKTLEVEIGKVASIDADLAMHELDRLIARQVMKDFHNLSDEERAAHLEKAIDLHLADLAKHDQTLKSVTKYGVKLPLDVLKRIAGVLKAQQAMLAANRAAEAVTAIDKIVQDAAKAGQITAEQKTLLGKVFHLIERADKNGALSSVATTAGVVALGMDIADGSYLSSREKFMNGNATIAKTVGSADSYAKLGFWLRGKKLADASVFTKATRFGKALRIAKFGGPIGDSIAAVLDGRSAYLNYQKGHTGEAVCDAGSATCATAVAIGGIAIAAGATGPAAPITMLVGTIGYFSFKGIKWLVADPDELKLIKEAGVFRDTSGAALQAIHDREAIKYFGSCTSDRRNCSGEVGENARRVYERMYGKKGAKHDSLDDFFNKQKTKDDFADILVEGTYKRVLGRASDPTGKAANMEFLRQGGTTAQLRTAFAGSTEGQAIITSAWKTKLGREPTPDERAKASEILRELGKDGVERATTDLRGNVMEARFVAEHGLAGYEKFHKRPGTCSSCH